MPLEQASFPVGDGTRNCESHLYDRQSTPWENLHHPSDHEPGNLPCERKINSTTLMYMHDNTIDG